MFLRTRNIWSRRIGMEVGRRGGRREFDVVHRLWLKVVETVLIDEGECRKCV